MPTYQQKRGRMGLLENKERTRNHVKFEVQEVLFSLVVQYEQILRKNNLFAPWRTETSA